MAISLSAIDGQKDSEIHLCEGSTFSVYNQVKISTYLQVRRNAHTMAKPKLHIRAKNGRKGKKNDIRVHQCSISKYCVWIPPRGVKIESRKIDNEKIPHNPSRQYPIMRHPLHPHHH
jgi:hypothetical protein